MPEDQEFSPQEMQSAIDRVMHNSNELSDEDKEIFQQAKRQERKQKNMSPERSQDDRNNATSPETPISETSFRDAYTTLRTSQSSLINENDRTIRSQLKAKQDEANSRISELLSEAIGSGKLDFVDGLIGDIRTRYDRAKDDGFISQEERRGIENAMTDARTHFLPDASLPNKLKGIDTYYLNFHLDAIRNSIGEMNVQDMNRTIDNNPNAPEQNLDKLGKHEFEGKSPAEQMLYVRGVLSEIEAHNVDLTTDNFLKDKHTYLKELSSVMNKDVKEEMQARLSLYQSSVLIDNTGGKIESIIEVIDTKLGPNKLAFSRDNLAQIFRSPDMRVDIGWDLLQRAGFQYKDIARQAGVSVGNNEDDVNYFTDQNNQRKSQIENYLMSVIYNNISLSQATKNALGNNQSQIDRYREQMTRKSFELTKRLYIVSREESVFKTPKASGVDDLAAAMRFRSWRKAQDIKGAQITIDRIPGFGTSWLRAGNENKHILYGREMLLTSQMDINKIQQFQEQYRGYLDKVGKMKEAFLDLKIDPKKMMDTDYLNGIAKTIRKVYGKENEEDARITFLMGVIQNGFNNKGLGWNNETLSAVRDFLKENGSLDEGYGGKFFPDTYSWKKLIPKTLSSKKLSEIGKQRLTGGRR